MASYKVPQDVEAEDKLIGPFSFRQFIYLIVAAMGILLAWGLSRIFIGLIVIPLPIIAFFLIIALPLRKDQPMETYLAAVVRFYLKPRLRMWVPEGTISLVNITAPKVIERQLTKGMSGAEASAQLSFLAQVVDTQGWSTRGVTSSNQSLVDTVVAEAQSTVDVLDDNTQVAQAFDQRINVSDEARKKAMLAQFQHAIQQPAAATPQEPPTQPALTTSTTQPAFNPYPSDIQQRVINPINDQSATPTPPASKDTKKVVSRPSAQKVSPDIIRLANNNDLSISTLANEAHRLQNDEEVEISLR